jgi:nucleoside-diphosphate-sugar epimerase
MRILVTGAAGFIGSHLTMRLLERGDEVAGVDDLNAYYDVRLKEARLQRIRALDGSANKFTFTKADIADQGTMQALFASARFDAVVNLAAQAGVRYSLENPYAYIDSNVTGFLNILEGVRRHGTGHLVYASTSSVYGTNKELPFKESRIPIRTSSAFPRPGSGSSRSMVLGGVRTWPSSSSPKGSSRARRSRSSTRVAWCAISPSSTTSSRASFA